MTRKIYKNINELRKYDKTTFRIYTIFLNQQTKKETSRNENLQIFTK